MDLIDEPVSGHKSTAYKKAQSLRVGHRAAVFEVRRDPLLTQKDVIRTISKDRGFPFVSGSSYKGNWNNDKKEGFGVQINSDDTKYEGEWYNNKYHGRGTLWVKKKKEYQRQYVGDWKNGKMNGQGVYYYSDGSVYRGSFVDNRKFGEGRYDYKNKDYYHGDWNDDMEDGFGSLYCTNGNIYEGLWVRGIKEGPGLFYYADSKKVYFLINQMSRFTSSETNPSTVLFFQVYQGEWHLNQARCGEFRDPSNEEELRFLRPLPKGIRANEFELPPLYLANPNGVLDIIVSEIRMDALHRGHSRGYQPEQPVELIIDQQSLEQANKVFNELSNPDTNLMPAYRIGDVLHELGLYLSDQDIYEVITQLKIPEYLEISFSETVEIGTYIHEQRNK